MGGASRDRVRLAPLATTLCRVSISRTHGSRDVGYSGVFKGGSMPDAKQLLVEEFVRLRHGWGLEAVNLHDRIGPNLADLADISPDDADRVIRRKISALVKQLSEELPAEDR